MAVLQITEFKGAAIRSGVMTPAYVVPFIASQSVTFTTTTQSAAFNAATTVVRLLSDTNCYVKFGLNPTATTLTDMKLTAGVSEDFYLDQSGLKVAAVT